MVEHNILLEKLEHYGVRGPNLEWFSSYLTNRNQYVHLQNRNSEMKKIEHGVPQGSILGPTLFIIYINDLPLSTNLAKFFIFADDSNLMLEASNPTELEHKCNAALNAVHEWVSRNGLKLNVEKTNLLYFTNNNQHKEFTMSVSLNGSKITRKDEAKFLGVIVDSKLNWKKHLTALKSKVSRNAGILYKLREILPTKALKNIYHGFIESHLLYCSAVWGTVPTSRLNNLFTAQKKAIRAISPDHVNFFFNPSNSNIPTHTKPIFKKLSLLALPNLITKNIVGILQKVKLGVAPSKIISLFQLSNLLPTVHNTRQEQSNIFVPRYFKLTRSNYQIAYAGPRLYNQIIQTASKYSSNNKVFSTKLSNKFFDPFKRSVTKLLLEIQSLPNLNLNSDANSWGDTNSLAVQAK